MTRYKTMTILGTRPEIIRLSALIRRLDAFTEHTLVHTGQNYASNLNEVFFSDLKLRLPDFYLEVPTDSLGTVIGETIMRVEKLLREIQPDAVFILGDTNSALAAIVAERLHIPVYHMEAGNRSFDSNVPEELNRRLVDHIATFNLPYNSHSHRNLLNEGLAPRFMCVTGSPLPEVFEIQKGDIEKSKVLDRLGLEPQQYILASVHRQENVDFPERCTKLFVSLSKLAEATGREVVVSTHPRTRLRLEENDLLKLPHLRFEEPMGYLDYNKLQMESYCVVSDSGTISEEASILGFPAVSIRESFERPESLEVGGMVLTGIGFEALERAVDWAISNPATGVPEGYQQHSFSQVVLNFMFSTVHLHRTWTGLHG